LLKATVVCTQLVNFVAIATKEMMKMIRFFISFLDSLWMDIIREEQKEYNKDKILYPNDGSDWRRELL